MSRIALIFLTLFSLAVTAPIDDVDPQKLCKNCPMLINLFLNNIPIEEKAFDKLCAKLLKADDSNPMVKVCEAGLMGEFEHIKEELAQSGTTPKQICEKLRICPAH
ncbi:hypothetical protein PRIPAC_84146 [Pristionchus pacificus]|uniref:Saposin B-type domain-containing protein n=1 Tax=Pristionchus pacificus TaxID=54126 RepID=A0A2A6BM00_PRIPA|nr:hypothetical protein PRIPAC_84146 [Pristionchus pacificus]|eukprot:PDM66962.1 hypothetical protein PRIPAC_48379 [Pristionchus pacificus]